MKVKKTLALLVLTGSLLLVSPSCTREEINIPSREEADRVPVALSLSVAGMEAGTPETKAIMEPDIDNPTLQEQIRNLVVLQFEGEGNAAKLVALPAYYKDAAKVFDGTEQVRLLPTSKQSVIAVVANTFDNIYAQSGMTLEQFLKMDYSHMSDYSAVFTRDLDGNDYIRMSGATVIQSISTNTPVEITLKRNVSKITINVKNTMPENADKVTLKKAQLRDINAKYYYLTNIDSFHDDYSGTDPYRIDKEPENLPEPNADGSYTFTYYVPANLRGTTGSVAQYSKALGAPEGATRFCLYGTYGSSSNTAINYTYYLGENLVNDFNLKPNYHYTYNITLASKGDARYDYRIEDCKEVKFKVDANSYIVQPPLGQGQSKIYAIPIRRTAVYWNPAGYNDGVYGASQGNSSQYIHENEAWTAEVLWSDFDLGDPSDFLVTASGEGYRGDKAYFRIKVKSGMKGNVIIAVRASGNIVWSWHIWITDYNPDREALASASGTYIYGVEGGNVHRYNNASFSANDKMFVMDRNLGASSASYAGLNGTMYYQFGRKDPFVGFNQNGDLDTYYTYDGGDTQKVTGTTVILRDQTGQWPKNILYSIKNPMTIILGKTPTTNSEWTLNDNMGGNSSIWMDDKYAEHIGNQQVLEKNKSIYDPCPPGWKVPLETAFDNVKEKSNGTIASEGLYYHPANGVSIYFPSHSFRAADYEGDKGKLITENFNNYGYLWTSVPQNNGTYEAAIALRFRNADQSVFITKYRQSCAFPVRCMRDSEYVRENYIAD